MQTTLHHGALPKHVQLRELLIREIAAGRLVDGERLPPERALADRFDVAVGTLRKALAELEARGMLERTQGSGNYVRACHEVDSVYALFRLERIAGGGLPTAEILSVDRRAKPEAAPPFGPGHDAHRIRRLRFLDALTVAVEEIWLDGRFAETLSPDELSESLYWSYSEAFNLHISVARDAVSVAPVPDWAPGAFVPSPGAVVGYVERLGWDQYGAAAEFSRTWFDPGRARYTTRLR